VCAKANRAKHPELDVPNLYVIKLCTSLKSREYVTENFCWNHYYFYLTNEGIQYLREYLHLPVDIVPATLKKRAPAARPGGPQGGDRGDRPERVGGGAGRGNRFGRGKDAGGPDSFQPSFQEEGGRGRGRGGAPADQQQQQQQQAAPVEASSEGW